jgi:hypothetical protein
MQSRSSICFPLYLIEKRTLVCGGSVSSSKRFMFVSFPVPFFGNTHHAYYAISRLPQ